MKKIVSVSVLMALVVLLASCGWGSETSSSTSNIAQTSIPVDESVEQVQSTPTVLAANYEEYNEGSLGEADSTVLFFHAPYCGSCTQTDKNLKESGVPEGTKVLKLDYDSNQELAEKYGVVKYHSFVQVDADGNKIKSWGGSLTAEDITAEVSAGDVMEKKDGDVMEKKDWDVMEKKDGDVMEKDESAEISVTDPVELAGVYSNYDASLVGQNDSTVLAFFATWCPSCVAADKNISAWQVPDGLSVLKVDYDSNTDLRKKYGVTSQHTFVQVDADGNLIKKWSGGNTLDSIVEKVQ